MAKTLNINLSPRQGLAYNDQSQFLLYGGAKGGGKSWFLCVWIFAQAKQNPYSKWFFFRKRGVDFTNTTLETWKKAVPAEEYVINPNLKKITINTSQAVIDYGGLDDELAVEKLNSAEYSGGAIDQAEEIEKDSFAMCRGTLRHKRRICLTHGEDACSQMCNGRDFPYQVRMSANPRQCWLKNDFILSPKKGFKFVPALPTDNPYLPATYVENLREAFQHRPELLKSYLEGSWDEVAGSNVCIKNSDIVRCRKTQPQGVVRKRIVVNDTARFGDDENVIYVMEQTDNVAYVSHQEIMLHRSTMDTAGRLAVLRNKFGATDIFVDVINVGSGVVDALSELGESVHEINASAKPTIVTEHKKYLNLRAQLWMEAGEKFAYGKCKTDDELLDGQLSSITFDYKSNGIIQVEAKSEIKKRLGRSPDRGDCFVMGLYALDQARTLLDNQSDSHDIVGHGHTVDSFNTESYTPFAQEPF